MNFSTKPFLVTLAMGELLTSTVCLIFSWQILSLNPRLDNLPALLGYIASIFGGTAAVSAIYGSTCSKPAWLLVHSVINMITMAIIIPTISAHVYVLAAAADGTRGVVPDMTLFVTRKMAWRIATQIVLFSMLIMMMFTSNIQANQLHKKMENEQLLQHRFEEYINTERLHRIVRNNYSDGINSVSIHL